MSEAKPDTRVVWTVAIRMDEMYLPTTRDVMDKILSALKAGGIPANGIVPIAWTTSEHLGSQGEESDAADVAANAHSAWLKQQFDKIDAEAGAR